MASLRIRIDGKEAFLEQLDRRLAQHQGKVGNAIQGAGIDMEARAKQYSPVGTPESTHRKGYIGGRLRAGNQYTKLSKLSCQVENRVKYAIWVDRGHITRSGSYVKPNPFWTVALIETKQSLRDELKTIKL